MENWIFLFLGLIFAYLLEFTRPWVKSFFKKRSLSFHDRRIDILIHQYRYIKLLRLEPQSGNYRILKEFSLGLTYVVFLIGWIGVVIFPSVLDQDTFQKTTEFFIIAETFIVTMMASAALVFTRIKSDIEEVLYFDEFKQETIKKLKKLGGNPEDLDKEETARG